MAISLSTASLVAIGVESSTLMSPKSWILIDAGTDVAANQEAILQGIKSKLSSAGGSLKLILCESPHFFLKVCVSPAKSSWQSTVWYVLQ